MAEPFTEDETFKKLQGLTLSQALEIYSAMSNDMGPVSYHNIMTEIDTELSKYGWSLSKLYGEFNKSQHG
jgi:hypothetical protein